MGKTVLARISIRLSAIMECALVDRSFGLDVARPDHLAPFLGFFGDKFSEVGRRALKHRAAQVCKPSLNLGISESPIDLFIELVNDCGWRVPGRADALP